MQKSVTIKPRLSEKSYGMSAQNVYVFDVDMELNKHEIAQAVEKVYEVDVLKVRVLVQDGKAMRAYRARRWVNGKRSDYKKAYVTIKEGQVIPVFAGLSDDEAEEKSEKKETK